MQKKFRLQKRCGMVVEWSPLIWFALSVVVCIGLFFGALSIGSSDQNGVHIVRVYCASAVVKPLTKIADRFNSGKIATAEKIRVDIVRTGGSGALTGQISAEALTGVQLIADVFVCADSNRLTVLEDTGIIVESFPVAVQFPVIAVRDDSKFDWSQTNNLSLLLNSKLKLGIGSVSSAIGFETSRFAKLSGCDALLDEKKTAEFENVMSLAQALSIGSIDVAILWDSTVTQFNQTDNRQIKIVTYLNAGDFVPVDGIQNPMEKLTSPPNNLPLADGSDKFPSNGRYVEVGRSKSVSSHADSFFTYLKNNRNINRSDFVEAGFSNYQPEPFLDNER